MCSRGRRPCSAPCGTGCIASAGRRQSDQPDDAGHDHHFLAHLPGNEVLHLDVVQRALEIQRLAAPLEGLRIAHLSDLHFSGRIGKAYFQEVVRLANEFSPELVAITGDLIDKDDYIDWIPDTLGRLQSRYGAYFVLGNHDLWIDHRRLRRTLAKCGLTDVGGRWLEIAVRGEPVVVAGNELPWFSPSCRSVHRAAAIGGRASACGGAVP